MPHEDLLAGLVIGALVVAVAAVATVKGAKVYRKAKSKWRRWCRTRLVITQAPKKKSKVRARR